MDWLRGACNTAIRLVAGFVLGGIVGVGASVISFQPRGFPEIPTTLVWLAVSALLAMGVCGYAAYWCIRMLSWPFSIRPGAAWAFLLGSVMLWAWTVCVALSAEESFAFTFFVVLRGLAPIVVAVYMVMRSRSREAASVQSPEPYGL